MNGSLHNLLTTLSWNSSHDTLFFAGDLLAKSDHSDSLAVWDYIYKNRINEQGRQVIYPVRGNHDQMVVQWRAWRDWFEGLVLPSPPRHHPITSFLPFGMPSFASFLGADSPNDGSDRVAVRTGRDFVNLIEAEWVFASSSGDSIPPDAEEYVDVARKRARGTWREHWWARIPKTPKRGQDTKVWKMFSDHYWLAKDMDREEAEWLMKDVPLVNWVSGLHTFVVHAGVLPGDPTLREDDERQPLARIPDYRQPANSAQVKSSIGRAEVIDQKIAGYTNAQEPLGPGLSMSDVNGSADPSSNVTALRRLQERNILTEVPQNTDPWVVLNMRSVKKNGKVSREMDQGKPGFGLPGEDYISDEDGENGLELDDEAQRSKKHRPKKYELKCYPSTVIYGHAATRGLDVKRWSFGLDTGCLYGRKLTALVLSRKAEPGSDGEDEDGEDEEGKEWAEALMKKTKFGDADAHIKARIVSVGCPNPDNEDD
ncbi:hypothetical protein BDY19DRAFT_1033480 [Irpex rosettiformis]|uniref:Uncharacterized protein n=1 Tax=Irpex rosettiformis TaxID=378272 RepID=A0ACB8UA78_9APHY|nr:hypothetical protein BDY19DRAFT_1033480 [Irpex rosettiformis]